MRASTTSHHHNLHSKSLPTHHNHTDTHSASSVQNPCIKERVTLLPRDLPNQLRLKTSTAQLDVVPILIYFLKSVGAGNAQTQVKTTSLPPFETVRALNGRRPFLFQPLLEDVLFHTSCTHTLRLAHKTQMLQTRNKGMELIRTSECGVPDRHASSKLMPRDIARQSEGEDCISLGIVGKEVVAIPVRGNSCRRLISSGGPCSVSCVSGRAYTVYLVQVRHKGQDYIIRRRFREFSALNDCIKDEDLRAIFPPRSLFAKGTLQ